MGAYRYCDECRGPQSQLDFDTIKDRAWSEDTKAICFHCGVDRYDDTPQERIRILIEEIQKLKEKSNAQA